MNREDSIRMAQEAGLPRVVIGGYADELVCFFQAAYAAGAAAEREACIIELDEIIAAIRARGETK